jgi:hypothetical protein
VQKKTKKKKLKAKRKLYALFTTMNKEPKNRP